MSRGGLDIADTADPPHVFDRFPDAHDNAPYRWRSLAGYVVLFLQPMADKRSGNEETETTPSKNADVTEVPGSSVCENPKEARDFEVKDVAESRTVRPLNSQEIEELMRAGRVLLVENFERNKTEPSVQIGRLMNIPPEATGVFIHTLQTFGSVRKAVGWLNDRCGALGGEIPLQLILNGQKDRVEAELDLIDEGVYV